MSDDPERSAATDAAARQPIFLLPTVVTALCGLMVAVHLARVLVLSPDADLQLVTWLGFLPFRLTDPNALEGGVLPMLWTPFTHAFLHGGWDHLILNTAWLAIFATPVARRYGAGRTLILFFVSAALGAALFAATTWGSLAVLIGASGGIAGLTGAATRFIFQPVLVAQDPETGKRLVLGRKLASWPELWANTRARYFTLIWIVMNAAVPLLPLVFGEDLMISWQAHLGGFLAGLVLVPLLERGHRGALAP